MQTRPIASRRVVTRLGLLLIWLGAGVVTGVVAPEARGAVFNPLNSSATIRHIAPPNTQGFGTDVFSVPGDEGWNLNDTLSPTPEQITTGFINVPDVSLASAGISHYTIAGNNGFGNVSLAYESGIGQTDVDQSTFMGASTLEIEFDMEWDISAGWIGPHYAYQFLGITLATAGPGDVSTVAGDFTYELDVFGEGIDTVDLHYDAMVQNGATNDFFLFESKLLRINDVPAAGNEGDGLSFLRMSGMWTFTAVDPLGPSSAILMNDDNGQLLEELFGAILPPPGAQLPTAIYQMQGGGVGNVDPVLVTEPDGNGVVPEPSGLGLLLGMGVVMLMRRNSLRT